MSAYAAEWKGVICDSMCGAKHADASEKSMACVKKCVKGGDEAVFITSDDKVLQIDNDSQAKVMPHLVSQSHRHRIDDGWSLENRIHQDVGSIM